MTAVTTFGSDASGISPVVARGAWRLLLVVFGALPAVMALTTHRLFRGPARFAPTNDAATWLLFGGMAVAVLVIFLTLPFVRLALTPVWLALIVFFAAPVLSAIAHGEPVGAGSAAGLVVFSAVALLPPPPLAWLGRAITTILAAYALGSLVAAVIAPGWAVQQQYEFSTLPGIDSRLHGLTAHANALGPLMVALVLLEIRRERKRPLVLGAAFVALTWSQSKTSWAVLTVLLGVEALRYFRQRSRRPVLPILIVLAVMALSVYIAAGIASGPEIDRRDNSAETLTGRTAVWQVTLEVWRQDWLLGYGPGLWDDAMDFRYRHRVGFAPGQAHNQLFQTLGVSGVVGAAALIWYLLALGALARRGDAVTRGGATALLALVVLRGFTETSMPVSSVGADFFLHLITFWYIGTSAAESQRRGSHPYANDQVLASRTR